MDFFNLWAFWPLLRCLQTNLPDEKIGRLRSKINIIQIIDHSLRLLAIVNRVRCSTNFTFVQQRVFPFYTVVIRLPRTETIRSQRSRAGIPFNLNPASKEMISDSVELCETEVYFLHIQLIETNVWLPKTHNGPTWCRFWVLEISRKIGVLKQSQSALFCCVTRIAILFVFTCMMDVRYQTIQSFITGFGPFRNRSCKFVHWPENIMSSNTCQIQAFQKYLRGYFWQFSYRFQFFFFEVVVIDAWSRYFVKLNCWVVLFSKSQYRSTHFLAWPCIS